jgi:MFS family permease
MSRARNTGASSSGGNGAAQREEPLLPSSLTSEVPIFKEEEARTPCLLLLMKVLYFLAGFSASSFGRFATLFYLDRGLSVVQIGIVESAQPPSSAVGNILFGYISDRLQRKKLIFVASRIISTVGITLFLVPPIGCCFHPILGMMIGVAFFSGPGMGLLDCFTLDLLGEARRGEYGRYRLWLAVSWGVGNAAMGALAQVNFNYNFVMFASLSALSVLLIILVLPARTQSERDVIACRQEMTTQAVNAAVDAARSVEEGGMENVQQSGQPPLAETLHTAGEAHVDGEEGADVHAPPSSVSIKAMWCGVVCRPRFLLFLAYTTFLGFLFCLVESFLFVYLTNELNAAPLLCGLSVGVTVTMELPIFAQAPAILKRLGHDAMFMLALLAYAVRAYGYTRLRIESVWWVLALEVLHGITFGLGWTAAVDRVRAAVPNEWQSSGQMLLSTAWYCVGRSIGALFGGVVMQHGVLWGLHGGKLLYTLAALMSAAVLGLHLVCALLLHACGAAPPMAPLPLAQPTSSPQASSHSEPEGQHRAESGDEHGQAEAQQAYYQRTRRALRGQRGGIN